MNHFEFYNPVKIIFGKGKISNLSKNIPEGAKIMITYGGGSIKSNGIYDQVISALSDREYVEFGGIEPNPSYETLSKAIEVVKDNEIDFLLAVGGGSVIDGTKFIAAASCYKGDNNWDIVEKQVRIEKALDLACVLTLSATGSEMNSGGVITRKATKQKLSFNSPLLFPKFSILDPETTYSLPVCQVSNGIVDAFVHVMEQYFTYPVDSPVQDRFSEGIMLTLISEGERFFLTDEPDYENRANLMWAATMALNGLISKGVESDWASHMIGHELTAFHGLDHAVTLAIVLPGLMFHLKDKREDKLLQYGERIWNISTGSKEERKLLAVEKTEEFFKQMGMATRLCDYEISQDSIDVIVDRIRERSYVGMQSDLNANDVACILKSRLTY